MKLYSVSLYGGSPTFYSSKVEAKRRARSLTLNLHREDGNNHTAEVMVFEVIPKISAKKALAVVLNKDVWWETREVLGRWVNGRSTT